MTRLGSLFVPIIRESAGMLYEFEKPYVVNSSKFEQTFDIKATPTGEAIRRTLEHYRLALPVIQTASERNICES